MASARVRKLSRDLHRQRVHERVRTRVEGTPERPRFHNGGTPIEYAVKMVQFPQDTLLSQFVNTGQLQGSHIDHLAHR